MIELELSIIVSKLQHADSIRPILDQFERQHRVRVHLTAMEWSRAWSDLANISIYSHGPDISEVGTSWIASLAATNSLWPLRPADIAALGGPQAFFEAVWQASRLPSDGQIWAVPWQVSPIVLCYRQDWLEAAGLRDGRAAFADGATLAQTLECLRLHGIAHPLGLRITDISDVIHEAAPWVWGAGGDFLSADGQRVLFNEPAALKGLQTYYSLGHYLLPQTEIVAIHEAYIQGQVAVIPGEAWVAIAQRQEDPAFAATLGIAPMPGVPYVGGTSLVIWKHSRHPEAASELARFLTFQARRVPGSPHSFQLPSRREAWQALVAEDSFYESFYDSLIRGRGLPVNRRWGIVEAQLTRALSTIWKEVLVDPATDVEEALHRYLDPLAKRLNLMLSS